MAVFGWLASEYNFFFSCYKVFWARDLKKWPGFPSKGGLVTLCWELAYHLLTLRLGTCHSSGHPQCWLHLSEPPRLVWARQVCTIEGGNRRSWTPSWSRLQTLGYTHGHSPNGLWTLCPVSIEVAYQWGTRPLDKRASGLGLGLSIA